MGHLYSTSADPTDDVHQQVLLGLVAGQPAQHGQVSVQQGLQPLPRAPDTDAQLKTPFRGQSFNLLLFPSNNDFCHSAGLEIHLQIHVLCIIYKSRTFQVVFVCIHVKDLIPEESRHSLSYWKLSILFVKIFIEIGDVIGGPIHHVTGPVLLHGSGT